MTQTQGGDSCAIAGGSRDSRRRVVTSLSCNVYRDGKLLTRKKDNYKTQGPLRDDRRTGRRRGKQAAINPQEESCARWTLCCEPAGLPYRSFSHHGWTLKQATTLHRRGSKVRRIRTPPPSGSRFNRPTAHQPDLYQSQSAVFVLFLL